VPSISVVFIATNTFFLFKMDKKRYSLILLFFILFVAVFLRFYRLGSLLPSLYIDEAFFGDLAYCVLTTGRDLQGVSWPLISHGHFTTVLPLQFYPTVVSIFVFGFDAFAIRFVPALLGVLIVLLTFLLARFLFNDFVALLSAFLVAVSPFHITYSRLGFGIFQLTFFFTLGLYLFLRGLKGNGRLMVLGGFCFGLTFFSYYLAHVFVVFFLFGFHYLWHADITSSGKRKPYHLLLFVTLLFFLASLGITPLDKVVAPRMAGDLPEFLSNLFEQLDVVFLFNSDWNWPPYTTGPSIFYPICVPLLPLGVFLLFHHNDRFSIPLIIYWLLLSFIVGAFTSTVFEGSIRRTFACAGPVFEIMIAYAVYRVLLFYQGNKRVFWLLFGLFSIGLLLGVHQFLVHYFVYQPTSIEAEKVFMLPVRELFNYTESLKDHYDRIIVTNNFDTITWPFIPVAFEDYYMSYTKKCVVDSKYVFGNVSSYTPNNRTLFVARDYEMVNATPKKVFPYSNGEVAYKIVA